LKDILTEHQPSAMRQHREFRSTENSPSSIDASANRVAAAAINQLNPRAPRNFLNNNASPRVWRYYIECFNHDVISGWMRTKPGKQSASTLIPFPHMEEKRSRRGGGGGITGLVYM